MGWKMVNKSLDKNRENREKMLLTVAKNSIRSKPPPSFRAVYHNKNHVITNTDILKTILINCIIVQIGYDIGGNFNIHIWACSSDFNEING